MNQTCKTCRWFVQETDYEGSCHRYPPQIVVYTDATDDDGNAMDYAVSHQPDTDPDGFCGEWAAIVKGFDNSAQLPLASTSAQAHNAGG